jgi:hypothetical protein
LQKGDNSIILGNMISILQFPPVSAASPEVVLHARRLRPALRQAKRLNLNLRFFIIRDKKYLLFPALIVPLSIIAGCAGTVDRGSLSEAVEQAKDDHRGDRRVENSHETDTSSGVTGCLFGFFSSSTDNSEPEMNTLLKRFFLIF